MSTDNGFIEFQLLGAGGDTDTIGYAIFRTPNANIDTYTRFAEEVVYRKSDQVVKSIWIISSSANNTVHFENSAMYADAIQLGSDAFNANSIDEFSESDIKISPNPTSGNALLSSSIKINGVFKLFDLTGHQVKTVLLNDYNSLIVLDDLSSGIYIYSIIDSNNLPIKIGKLIVN